MISQLVQKCVVEARSEAPKFSLSLALENNRRSGLLKFQEISLYRALSHLTLKFQAGSDSQIKEYLAQTLRKLQEEGEGRTKALEAKIQTLEGQVAHLTGNLEKKVEECEKLRQEAYESNSSQRSKMTQEIAVEKERSARALNDLQLRYDSERRKMSEEHTRSARQMENRIAALEYENKDLSEKKMRNEASVQRLTEQMRNQQEDILGLKKELESKKFENSKLDSGCHDRERVLNQLQTKVAMLEQENTRLQTELGRQGESLRIANEQKIRLEQELHEKKGLVQRREEAVRNVSQELYKANEIIHKFQQQVKSEHSKVKLSAKIIEEQEKVVGQKDTELTSIREDLKKLSDELGAKKREISEAEISQLKMVDQIAELEKKLKTNEGVIDWLNKQLTSVQAKHPNLKLAPPPRELGSMVAFTPSGMGAMSTPADRPTGVRRKTTLGTSNVAPRSIETHRPSNNRGKEK